ncbi:antitoxin [Microbacterium sp. BWT-B31]|uniref:antitoxin n=1 Tax=Microbacterium sp. BWT-B31 TaxID=3232072 RepID=UPI0035290BEF
MRTTLDIDDEILAAARAIARADGVSIGAALSRLARQGLTGIGPIDIASGFPTFAVERTSPPITLDRVNEHRD